MIRRAERMGGWKLRGWSLGSKGCAVLSVLLGLAALGAAQQEVVTPHAKQECSCKEPGCTCVVKFTDVNVHPTTFPTTQGATLIGLQVSVSVLCSSIPSERNVSFIKINGVNVLPNPKIITSQRDCCEGGVESEMREDKLLDAYEIRPNGGEFPNELIVEVDEAGQGYDCNGDVHYFKAYVRLWRGFDTGDADDSTTRLLLGIVFAIVWSVIMVVPVILWLRRRRANNLENATQNHQLLRPGTTRRNAREHAIRTRPRRFKVMRKADWEGQPGDQRRRHGWMLADESVVSQARDIIEKDSSLLGRHAPNVVVARMEAGWIRITRPRERGQPRLVEVSSEPFEERDTEADDDYILVTIPQSVQYGQGVSGQIAVDVHGNVLPWQGSKESAEFRKKVDKLRRTIDRSRRPRFGRDRDELPLYVDRQNVYVQNSVQALIQCITSLIANFVFSRSFESSFEAIKGLNSAQLARRFQIQFLGEEGSDFGGVRREWFHLITLEMVKPEYGMFEPSDSDVYTYQLATHIDTKAGEKIVGAQSVVRGEMEQLVEYLHFAGQILAKCIVDQQLCAVHFTSAVYKKLLLRPFTVEDLESVDRELFHSLEWVLETNADEDDLGMYMSVDTTDTDGNHVTVDLIEGGSDIPVTESNKVEFVQKMINWRLVDRVAVQTDALVAGFQSVLPLELMEPFEPHELELLVCGSSEVDMEDWKFNTLYKSGYTPDSEVIKWFWDMTEKMKNEERLKLLQFVTGTSSVPSRGFAHLLGSDGERRFSIVRVPDISRLPQAHTCFNELILPEYPTREDLEAKLIQALSHLGDGMLLR